MYTLLVEIDALAPGARGSRRRGEVIYVSVCSVWVPCVALPSGGGSSVGSFPLCGSPVGGVPLLACPRSMWHLLACCLALVHTLPHNNLLTLLYVNTYIAVFIGGTMHAYIYIYFFDESDALAPARGAAGDVVRI